jgi:hypothetical protein
MNKLDQRLQATFQRVNEFGIAHGADFTPGGPAVQAFAFIATLVPKAGTDAGAQVAGAGEKMAGTGSRAAVRVALHNELASITATAHSIALTTPGFDNKFHLPRSGSDLALLASAVSFVAEGTPLIATFVAHEMPADTFTVTQSLIDQFKATGVAQDAGKSKQVGATATMADDRHKGVLMLETLKGIVPNKYKDNPAVLAEWHTASHVERPAQKEKTTPAPTTATTK